MQDLVGKVFPWKILQGLDYKNVARSLQEFHSFSTSKPSFLTILSRVSNIQQRFSPVKEIYDWVHDPTQKKQILNLIPDVGETIADSLKKKIKPMPVRNLTNQLQLADLQLFPPSIPAMN